MPRAGDLLYELSVGLRDQVRLIDAGRDEPLAIEMSTSLRDTRERVLVHVAERRYEVVRHGPVGQVDLRFSSHGLALLARREAQLPELVATGELEVAGDIRTVSAAATHLTPRF